MREKILGIYLVAVILGLLTGLAGSFFQLFIQGLKTNIDRLLAYPVLQGFTASLLSAVISMTLVLLAWLMVRYISPEASGSGVQEMEGVLLHQRPIFWRRLLPVKFIGGIMSISASMILGREGPTIQLGGNLGDMLGELLKISREKRDTLIAAGAAAGLATAFNAPLAGVLFIIEEMRNAFDFTFTNFKIVTISCVMATITLQCVVGSGPAIPMAIFGMPSLKSLFLFFILGLLVGIVGLLFNKLLMKSLALSDKLSSSGHVFYVLVVGFSVGLLHYFYPLVVGGGYEIIEKSLTITLSLSVLALLFLLRFFILMFCYTTAVPGGIFAPLLSLGTLLGLVISLLLQIIMQDDSLQPGIFAVAGMGALFAAAVRAPITGIVLVVEMTQNYYLILPLMISCLTSTTVMQLANNPPIYTQLLERTLNKTEKS